MFIIYGFFDLFYLLLLTILPYRKKVIDSNLRKSFPGLSDKEIKKIRRKFYRYFSNLFAESVKNLFISEKNLLKRIKVRNPEIINQFADQHKSVILLSSHYNNWEFLITSQNLLFNFQAIGIGTPLSNKYWDKKITKRRERYGMQVVHANNYKDVLKKKDDKPKAVLLLGDQSPGKDENCFWTQFLNQTTAFYFGAEFMANEFDLPVISATIHKVKRGYYEIELELISANPTCEKYGYITSKYIEILEKEIKHKPEYWLWSHKRWKKRIPENIELLKTQHQNKFLNRFRKEKISAGNL